jgi:hypothetical protein
MVNNIYFARSYDEQRRAWLPFTKDKLITLVGPLVGDAVDGFQFSSGK